jgi:hypothetical protein
MRYLIAIAMLVVLLPPESVAQQTPVDAGEFPPGWWAIPKTSTRLKVGGYVKFDLIHDFKPIGSPDFFDVSKIPTDGSVGKTTHLNAKEARINLDVKTPSKVGELRMFVEGDFYGANGTLRLRHAYVEIGDWLLAGQTWSNFMDENTIPGTLDFEKPGAYVFTRLPIVRFKKNLAEGSYVSLALEQPNSSSVVPAEPGKFENPVPDLTLRFRHSKPWGHVQASAFGALVRYRFSAGGTDEVQAFGVNLSGQFNVAGKDKLTYQAAYGPGLGRYRGLLTAALDENGNLEAITEMGITISYQHQWNESFSSLVVFNRGVAENTAGQGPNAIHAEHYGAGNLLWHFAPNAFAGVEFLTGLREDVDGAKGTANRLQFSVKYGL